MIELFTVAEFQAAKSRDLLELECHQCGGIFTQYKSQIQWSRNPSSNQESKYCSRKCSAASLKNRKTVPCKKCNKPVDRVLSQHDKNQGNVFCSLSCSATFNNLDRIVSLGSYPKRSGKWKSCEGCGGTTKNRHYCTRECGKRHTESVWLQRIVSGHNIHEQEQQARKIAKRYLIEQKGHVCSVCDNTVWMGQLIPLTCDHIDGDLENNKISNFRLICANCDRQQPTFGSRNAGNGKKSSRSRRKSIG